MKNPIDNFSPLAYPQGSVTQFFGENKELYKTVCSTPNTCLEFGHNGWDIVGPWGNPIYCVMTGKVVEVKNSDTGYGKHIRILCPIAGEKRLEWVYGHMSRIDVVPGQQLTEGDQIGLMGNTGFVVSGATPYWKYNPYAGTHLHLGVKIISPETGGWDVSYSTGDKGTMENYRNGFLGSVDPRPFLDPKEPEFPPTTNLTAQSIINQIKVLWAKIRVLQGVDK